MEFRRFRESVIALPSQVVETARGLVIRVLAVTDRLAEVMEAHANWKRIRFT